MTIEELKKKIEALGEISEDQRNSIICSLIGHSRISSTWFGYRYCGRCGVQLGDSLGGVDFGGASAVIIGHKCETCQKNYESCTWEDRLFVKDPFAENDESAKILLTL